MAAAVVRPLTEEVLSYTPLAEEEEEEEVGGGV
jgi:hypothetical protein